MPRGRPSKLTPELQAEFLCVLRRTCFLETAADLVGVDRSTVYRWLKAGRRRPVDEQGQPTPEGQFCSAIKKVLAEKEADRLERIVELGQESWQALAWICERVAPQRWSDCRKELRRLRQQVQQLLRDQAHGAVLS